MYKKNINEIREFGFTKIENVFNKELCKSAKEISKKHINNLSSIINYDDHDGDPRNFNDITNLDNILG